MHDENKMHAYINEMHIQIIQCITMHTESEYACLNEYARRVDMHAWMDMHATSPLN